MLHLYSPSVAGHADHFKFCEEMRPVANSALQLFRFDDNEQRWVSESADVDPVNIAASALQRIVAVVEGWQKLIRLADRSELNWRVVQHYLADPIADSADNERRIKKATKSAATELKAEQDKRGEFGFSFLSFVYYISVVKYFASWEFMTLFT